MSWTASEQRVCCGGRFLVVQRVAPFFCLSVTWSYAFQFDTTWNRGKISTKWRKSIFLCPCFSLTSSSFKCHPISLWLEYTVRKRKILIGDSCSVHRQHDPRIIGTELLTIEPDQRHIVHKHTRSIHKALLLCTQNMYCCLADSSTQQWRRKHHVDFWLTKVTKAKKKR